MFLELYKYILNIKYFVFWKNLRNIVVKFETNLVMIGRIQYNHFKTIKDI